MASDFPGPINIGSDEMVTINQLVEMAAGVEGKLVTKRHKLEAPTGVRGRNSDNRLIRRVLNWDYEIGLEAGVKSTYIWIKGQRENGDLKS